MNLFSQIRESHLYPVQLIFKLVSFFLLLFAFSSTYLQYVLDSSSLVVDYFSSISKRYGAIQKQLFLQAYFWKLALMQRHPEETSKVSDICDFSKVSDIENSMVVNGKMYILNDTSQFSEHILEIYI